MFGRFAKYSEPSVPKSEGFANFVGIILSIGKFYFRHSEFETRRFEEFMFIFVDLALFWYVYIL